MTVASPSTRRGRATRERIIRAAAELVAERGVAAVSLDDVGACAPASRSQLYHYFDDKEALIRAVVDATSDAVLGAQDENPALNIDTVLCATSQRTDECTPSARHSPTGTSCCAMLILCSLR